jgi:hypothetical protein
MQVVFYKAGGKWIDKLIRWWTMSPYSHCELLFPDGTMFSADAWSGGVRYRTEFKPSNWDYVYLPMADDLVAQLRTWCDEHNGLKYDWLGIFGFVLPVFKGSKKRWFCSEICCAGLQEVGVISEDVEAGKQAPHDLYVLLTQFHRR